MQNLFRNIENMMAAVAFAESDEKTTALEIAFPEQENVQRKEETREIQEENRPVLYS